MIEAPTIGLTTRTSKDAGVIHLVVGAVVRLEADERAVLDRGYERAAPATVVSWTAGAHATLGSGDLLRKACVAGRHERKISSRESCHCPTRDRAPLQEAPP